MNPIQSWDLYFLATDFFKTRSDIEGFNSNTFSNYENRFTMATYQLYSLKDDSKVGVMSASQTHIQSDDIYTNILTNTFINVFDQVVIPNHSSAYITKKNGQQNPNPYANLDNITFPRSITQDMIGRKVVILNLPNNPNDPAKVNFRIELYDEDL